MPRLSVLLLAALFAAGCNGAGCTTSSTVTAPPTPKLNPPSNSGLTGGDATRFHHLSEGTELYPLSWLLALTNPGDGKPFLDNPERFGLLSDSDRGEDNPYGLPIGLTTDYTRDLRFAGVKMTGVNCAACHVSELRLGGKVVMRIDGSPNLFDLELFYSDLVKATRATIENPTNLWAFLRRLSNVPQLVGAPFLAPSPKYAKLALDSYPNFDDLKDRTGLNKGEQSLENVLASTIAELHKEQLEKPPARRPAFDFTKPPNPTGPWAKLDAPTQRAAVSELLSWFLDTMGLMGARVAYIDSLGGTPARTAPGYGRVDAFGRTRNVIFGQKLALTAPISCPHLWNLNEMNWLHWDENTTSLLELNVGKALGLGAVFDPVTFESTVAVSHLEDLERLARKITPPAWPVAAFGTIDEAKKTKGREVFVARCQNCHADLVAGNHTMPDKRFDLDKIGTDPVRANNFARPVNDKPFNVALSDALKSIARKGGGTVSDKNEWRVTNQYGARPLVASWATAPYLHNNSVPTIYDLLLPAEQRPKVFWVGSREYDPKKLGFKSDEAEWRFKFDTSLPGNGNGGHTGKEYGTDMSEAERMELLEYLKSVR